MEFTQVMSIDLIILGLLLEHPMSAYDIVTTLQNRKADKWVKISQQAVYRNVTLLHKKGFLEAEQHRSGSMPPKTIYTLNEEGRERFFELMHSVSSSPWKIHFDFNAVIVNLHRVSAQEGLELLTHIRRQLQQKKDDFEQLKPRHVVPIGARGVIRQYEVIYTALLEWVEALIEEWKTEHSMRESSRDDSDGHCQ